LKAGYDAAVIADYELGASRTPARARMTIEIAVLEYEPAPEETDVAH
jgi:hypothetical protein